MVDKSWGVSGTPSLRVRSNATPDQRTPVRADAMAQRQEERQARRDADLKARETERTERREREQQLAVGDPHAAAASRRRSSGRRDVVREQRDTSGYATIVDVARIRALAGRGASLTSLASVFAVSEDEIARVLAGPD